MKSKNKNKILFVANDFDIVIYRFRKEILQSFVSKGIKVILACPHSDNAESFCLRHNIKLIKINVDRRGKNLFKDLFLLLKYFKIIKKESPDYIFSYTIKPNIYIGLVNLFFKKKFYPNVTGLGSIFANQGLSKKIVSILYKISFRNVTKVFFQNEQNKQLFLDQKIVIKEKSILLPGSGVNLKENFYVKYPKNNGQTKFIFLGRIMKEKGIYELLEAFSILEKKYDNIHLDIYGFCEEDNIEFLKKIIQKIERAKYHGFTNESNKIILNYHAIIQPSYEGYEGLSNSLLEAAAIGRAIITTNVCGCKEIVDDNFSGYLSESKNINSLIFALEKFINLEYEKKINMGINAHNKVRENFDRMIVVKKYMELL